MRRTREEQRAIYSNPQWRMVSAIMKERTGYRCEECGGHGNLQTHHIVPISKGGEPYDESNLKVLCKPCHDNHHKYKPQTPGRDEWIGYVNGFTQ